MKKIINFLMKKIKSILKSEENNTLDKKIEFLLYSENVEIEAPVLYQVSFKLQILNSNLVDVELDRLIVNTDYLINLSEVLSFERIVIKSGEKVIIQLSSEISYQKVLFLNRIYQPEGENKGMLKVYAAFNSSKNDFSVKQIINDVDICLCNAHLLEFINNKNLIDIQEKST